MKESEKNAALQKQPRKNTGVLVFHELYVNQPNGMTATGNGLGLPQQRSREVLVSTLFSQLLRALELRGLVES